MQAPRRRRHRRGERSAAGRRLRERVPERSPPDPLDGRRLVGLGRLRGCFRRGLRGGLRLRRLLRACWIFHGAQFTVSVTCRSNERGSPSVSRSSSAPSACLAWPPSARRARLTGCPCPTRLTAIALTYGPAAATASCFI